MCWKEKSILSELPYYKLEQNRIYAESIKMNPGGYGWVKNLSAADKTIYVRKGVFGKYIVNKMLSKYDRNMEYLMVKVRKAYCGNSDNFSNVPQHV